MGFFAKNEGHDSLVKKWFMFLTPDDTATLAEHSEELKPKIEERHAFFAKWRERAEMGLVMCGVALPAAAVVLGGVVGLGVAALGIVAGVSLGGGAFAGAAMAFFGAAMVGGPPMIACLASLPFLENRERVAAAKLEFLDSLDNGRRTLAPEEHVTRAKRLHVGYLAKDLREMFNEAHDGDPPAPQQPKPAHVPSFGGAVLRPA